MKLKAMFVTLVTLLSLNLQAKQVELNSTNVNLGNIGDIRNLGEIQTNGAATLLRSEKTPVKVKLNFEVKEPRTICARQETYSYPCGCYGYGRPPRYPYPPYPTPYPPYGCGMCTSVRCVEYKDVLVNVDRSVKLNFKKAEKLIENDVENFDLKITSDGYGLDYDIQAPNYYKVRKIFGKNFKFIKQ